MSMTRHVILNYVDTPLRVLFWTIPELLMLIIPLFLGLLVNQLLLGLGVSLFYFWANKKYQQIFGKGQLQPVMYWYLPTNQRFKSLPASYIREYIG